MRTAHHGAQGATSAVGALLLWAFTAPAIGAVDAGALPSEECVRLLRGARIAGMQGDTGAELEKLEAALDACPGEISPLYALVGYYRRQPELEEDYRKFLSRLVKRLEDPEFDLPLGVIEYLIRGRVPLAPLRGDPDVEEDELAAVLDNISRQVERSAEPDPGLMRIQAELQQRLGRTEDAVVTLERLWRQTGAGDLIWPLTRIYSDLERWQDAAELISSQLEEEGGGQFRTFYIHVLGKLGRYDEVLKQVKILVSDPGVRGVSQQGELAEAVELNIDLQGYVIDVVLQPGLLGLLKQVAWDLRDRGQDAQAEQIFRSLLAQAPDDPELRSTVLNLYAGEEERQGHAEALADRWQTETDPNVLFEEGTQRLTAGDASGAIELLRRAAPEFPDLEAAWYNLGMAAYRLEDWATVDTAFGRAGELNPARAQAFFFRGLALEKLGRCVEAVGALGRAVELDPARSLAYYYLAACHRKLGDQAAAAAAMQRYEATKD